MPSKTRSQRLILAELLAAREFGAERETSQGWQIPGSREVLGFGLVSSLRHPLIPVPPLPSSSRATATRWQQDTPTTQNLFQLTMVPKKNLSPTGKTACGA